MYTWNLKLIRAVRSRRQLLGRRGDMPEVSLPKGWLKSQMEVVMERVSKWPPELKVLTEINSELRIHKVSKENRFVWVFEVMDGQGTLDNPWKFKKYIATGYTTQNHSEARDLAMLEYGYVIRGAERRELTFPEYCALLKCNDENSPEVYQAMLRILYTGTITSLE